MVITPAGGTGPYTITPAQTGLNAGLHTFTVTDANGCSISVPITITQPAALTATFTQTNVLCNGASTGTVSITPAGGTGPYTIAPVQVGLSAGLHTFTVTDANNCSISVPITITQPAALTATFTQTNILCNGGTTGTVSITPAGGTGPYTISPVQVGLGAGLHTFTVTDANNCSIDVPVTITQASPILLTETHTDASCGSSTGSIDLTITGGTSPYTYLWSQGASTEDITGLAAGAYNVTVTDANLCSETLTVTISQPTAISITETHTDLVCNGISTGSIDLSVTGGIPPYTYLWSNGATTEDISGLAAGTYTVTITDGGGCPAIQSVTITEPVSLTATFTQNNVLCNGASTGTVSITPAGGTGPYTIAPVQTGLNAGLHTFTVTDANNCSISVPITITQPAALTATFTQTNILCNGGTTGTVSITPAGGTGPYTISPVQVGLGAGLHTFTVTDANNCSIDVPVTITQASPILLTEIHTDASCGTSTGSIDLTITGGTSPYTYLWSQGASTEDITGLAAGAYNVTVTDANLCSETLTVTISQPTAISITETHTDLVCNGISTGSIDLSVTGGIPPYTYLWSNGATTEDISGLAAGTYTVTITDGGGCPAIQSVTITEPVSLTATFTQNNVLCNGASTGTVSITPAGGTGPYTIAPVQTGLNAGLHTFTVTDANNCSIDVPVTITQASPILLTETHTDASCGSSTGSIDLTITGGTSPYTYLWSQGASTEDITGLAAGAYNVTVTDANLCSETLTVTISQPTAISITETHTDLVCNGISTGSIDLSVTGGIPPYTYLWSNGATTEDISGLAAGTYTVTITDGGGCPAIQSVTITEPVSLTATFTQNNVLCNGASTGTVSITPAGGTGPYTIAPVQTGLNAGLHTFTVTDANSCSISVPITITQPAALTATFTQTNILCNGGTTGTVSITPAGGTGPYTISPVQVGLGAGLHTFTVTDANNCSIDVPVTITQASPILLTETHTDASCGTSTGSIDLTITGGTSPYTYLWSQGASTEDITGLAAGAYNVTVTDANLCSETLTVTISQPTAISITETHTDLVCNGISTGSIDLTVTGGIPPYTYLWSNGATTEDISGLAAGTYTVTITDGGGCPAIQSVTITEPVSLTATFTQTNVLCNGASTGTVSITPAGGTGPYTITPVQTGLNAGLHTFTVTDANGCSISVPITITQPAALTATFTQTNILCNGGTTGTVSITPAGGTGPYTISPVQVGLGAGLHTFTVTDANNCSIDVPVTITESSAITTIITAQVHIL